MQGDREDASCHSHRFKGELASAFRGLGAEEASGER